MWLVSVQVLPFRGLLQHNHVSLSGAGLSFYLHIPEKNQGRTTCGPAKELGERSECQAARNETSSCDVHWALNRF